jgi:hypothetical protein
MMQAAESTLEAVIAASEDELDESDEFESVGDHHRAAAQHFAAAARHHLLAAAADDEGDADSADRHSYLAYRHRLNGIQYAEIAVMDSESLEDVIESEL